MVLEVSVHILVSQEFSFRKNTIFHIEDIGQRRSPLVQKSSEERRYGDMVEACRISTTSAINCATIKKHALNKENCFKIKIKKVRRHIQVKKSCKSLLVYAIWSHHVSKCKSRKRSEDSLPTLRSECMIITNDISFASFIQQAVKLYSYISRYVM